MYKNFNLTEEERKQILESHKSHGYKKPLNEKIYDKEYDVVRGNPDFKPQTGKPSDLYLKKRAAAKQFQQDFQQEFPDPGKEVRPYWEKDKAMPSGDSEIETDIKRDPPNRFSILCTLGEALENSALATLEGIFIIIAHAIFVLEDLRLNDIFKCFMGLILKTGLNKVVFLELELALSSNGLLVYLLLCVVIFGVTLEVTLEVVAVHLFFLCESSKEVGVVFSPSLALALEHALFSAFVIFGVNKLS
jgi:hypothetical protein